MFRKQLNVDHGELVWFLKVMSFKRDSSKAFNSSLKFSHGQLQREQVVSYKIQGRPRGRRSGDQVPAELEKKYPDPAPVKKAKYDDLQKVICLVPPVHHNFFKGIPFLRFTGMPSGLLATIHYQPLSSRQPSEEVSAGASSSRKEGGEDEHMEEERD